MKNPWIKYIKGEVFPHYHVMYRLKRMQKVHGGTMQNYYGYYDVENMMWRDSGHIALLDPDYFLNEDLIPQPGDETFEFENKDNVTFTMRGNKKLVTIKLEK